MDPPIKSTHLFVSKHIWPSLVLKHRQLEWKIGKQSYIRLLYEWRLLSTTRAIMGTAPRHLIKSSACFSHDPGRFCLEGFNLFSIVYLLLWRPRNVGSPGTRASTPIPPPLIDGPDLFTVHYILRPLRKPPVRMCPDTKF